MVQFIKIVYPSLTNPYNSWSDKTLETETNTYADALDGNPDFVSIAPAVADYKVQVSGFATLRAKCASRDSDAIAAKNVARRDLILSTIQIGVSVQQISAGDVVKLMSSKMPIRRLPQPVVVEKPTGLTLTPGINPGELVVRVNGMKKVSLIIEYSLDPAVPDNQWESVTTTTCTYTLTGLQGGKRYWIRLAAVGGNNQVVWGDTLQSPYIQQL